jgi:hypothetical protein
MAATVRCSKWIEGRLVLRQPNIRMVPEFRLVVTNMLLCVKLRIAGDANQVRVHAHVRLLKDSSVNRNYTNDTQAP